MLLAKSSPAPKTAWPRQPRILKRRGLSAVTHPKPRLILPGLMHATVLPDLELLPLPEVGFDLTLPEFPFASIRASAYDGPTLSRLLDRLQVQTR